MDSPRSNNTDPTPVAWMHTLHMEGGQTHTRLLDHDGTNEYEPSRTGFGIPGRDYSEEYAVTATPLYAHPPAVPADGLVEALAKGIYTEVSLDKPAALAAHRGEA